MNKKYNNISTILNEQEYFGPKTKFRPDKDEKILFQCENISHIEDERWIVKFENLDPRGVLIITNKRVFFQAKYFTVAKEIDVVIPIESIASVKFRFSKIFNRSLEIYYNDEKRKYRKSIFWAPLFLKSYGGINAPGILFRKLKEAYELLQKLIK